MSWITVPLKENPDDDTSYTMVQWPILLPHDFVAGCCLSQTTNFAFRVLIGKNVSILAHPWGSLSQPQAATLLSEGYLSALFSDFKELPSYWEGMLKDFPNHPVQQTDPGLCASVGCTLYSA